MMREYMESVHVVLPAVVEGQTAGSPGCAKTVVEHSPRRAAAVAAMMADEERMVLHAESVLPS